MGYFDALTEAGFKKNKEGAVVFFPWGILGKGRVLLDEAAEAKVRRFVSRYYKITLPITIGAGVFIGWKWAFILCPFFCAWFIFGAKSLVSSFPYSEEKMTARESYGNSAARHNKFTLWLLSLCSVAFVLAGFFIAFTAKAWQQKMMGCLSIAFFGACGAAIGYMLKQKYSKPAA